MAGADTTTVGTLRRRSPYALIVLDLISDFSFPGGEELIRPALAAARNIALLRERARQRRVPCIYVNDNRGHWNTDRDEHIRTCLDAQTAAARIVELLLPAADDFFMMKPRHSGFFATPLHTLLNQLAVRTLILTGVTTHQCVLFTAVDAYMRDFDLIIPGDCVASAAAADSKRALALFASSMNARIGPQRTVRFEQKSRTRKTRKTAAP